MTEEQARLEMTYLTISLETYGENKGKYKGTVSFRNSTGKIEICLDNAISGRVLELVGDELIESSKRLASQMTRSILEPATAAPQIAGGGTG